MPKIFGELQSATFENLSSDPSGSVAGRFWRNSTSGFFKTDDGSNKRSFLRNDQQIIIGNNGTANSNVRFNRAAAGVLQAVLGGDVTAEGSLSTAVAQFSSRHENYTDAGKPAAGNAGRLIWVTDQSTLKIDTGSTWLPVGSGGSGGALRWVEDAEAPVSDIEFNSQVYFYTAGETQNLYAWVKVPASYVAGQQINLRMSAYSPDTSGNILISTQSTLIRAATDAMDSTTNQRTSTNTAITLGAGTVNEPQSIVFDLTSTSGQINSVSVAAGDLIKVRLFRGTDTATGDVRALVYATEASFT